MPAGTLKRTFLVEGCWFLGRTARVQSRDLLCGKHKLTMMMIVIMVIMMIMIKKIVIMVIFAYLEGLLFRGYSSLRF